MCSRVPQDSWFVSNNRRAGRQPYGLGDGMQATLSDQNWNTMKSGSNWKNLLWLIIILVLIYWVYKWLAGRNGAFYDEFIGDYEDDEYYPGGGHHHWLLWLVVIVIVLWMIFKRRPS